MGAAGEALAGRYLEAQGYTVLERNLAWGRGELDLVARAGDGTIVVVEVRTRRGPRAGATAADTLTGREQRRLLAFTASYAAARHPGASTRIDLLAIGVRDSGNLEVVEHIISAVEERR